MIVSTLTLDRADIKALSIFDDYSLHRVVYTLFPQNKRDFLFYDLGGNRDFRKILILSENQPQVPANGSIESKNLPENFLQHSTYAFQVLLNPVRRKADDKTLLPIKGQDDLKRWFLTKESAWGFKVNPTTLEVSETGVQVIEKGNNKITLNRAKFRGILEVTDQNRFEFIFCNGLGKAKAFGFGLLQLKQLINN